MKNYYIFKALLLIILSVEIGFGQSGTPYYKQISEKQVPPSPSVAALGKYGDVPVSYYTGVPNLSVPIYDIKSKDLSMPINLSYHGGAIRVEEESSIVGLGWSLNAGGVISRNIRGSKGGEFDSYFKLGNNSCIEVCQGVLDDASINLRGVKDNYAFAIKSGYPSSPIQNCIGSTGGSVHDLEPDIFSFNVGGQSGKFFLDRPAAGSNLTYSVKILSQATFQVKLINNDVSGNSGFEIITDDGTKYIFNKIEYQSSEYDGTPCNTGKHMILDNATGNYIDAIPYTNIGLETTMIAWHLTSIESTNGDKITLTYTDSNKFLRALNSRTQSLSSCAANYDYSWNQTRIYNKPVYLESITFDNGKVNFTYNTREDLSAKGVEGLTTDIPWQQKRLTNVTVSKFDGITYTNLKEFVLDNNDYFNSGTNRPSHLSKRLKLNSVKEKVGSTELPPYSFEYENTVNLPDKDSYDIDHWGYYNGYNNSSLIPGSDLFVNITSPFKKFTLTDTPANRAFDTSSDFRYIKSGTIKKMTYPTGGSSLFYFEPNTFCNAATSSLGNIRPFILDKTILSESVRIKGAGLRISRIDNLLENNSIASTKKYSYLAGRLMAPVEYFTAKFNFNTTIDPQDPCKTAIYNISSQNVFSSLSAGGNIIGYDRVEVSDLSSTLGKQVYHYENIPQLQNSYFYFRYNLVPDSKGSYFTYDSDGEWSQSWGRIIGNGAGGIFTNICYSFFNVPSVINNINGTLKKEESFKAGVNSSLTLTRRVIYNNTLENSIKGKAYRIQSINSFSAEILSYDIVSSWTKLNSKEEYNYDNAADGDIAGDDLKALTSTTLFEYNPTFRQIKKKTNTTSKGDILISTYDYPYDINTASYVQMVAKNIIAPVVKEEFYKNSILSTNLLSSKVTSFTSFLGIGNNYNYLPNYIETKRPLEQDYTRELTFDTYDVNGNPTQFVDRSGITTLLTYFNGSGKKNLLNTKTTGILTTTYDYYPLIGLSKVTDPNGKYMTYVYDDLNRLKSISDQTGILKSYTYHYGSQSVTDVYTPLVAAAIATTTLDCEAECRVEAYAKPILPITNCTAGQFTLDASSSSTGTDVTYKWAGPNQYVSNTKSPTISGNLINYAGVYTLTVTRNNSNCVSTATATTEVILDCNCPFVINTNGSSSGTLSCYQTISLVSNCQGCSTGDVAPGTETFVANGNFSNGDVDFSCDAANRFVTTNPVNIVGSFNSFGDHTGNVPYNNMLLVGHSDNREEKVWYRSMTIKPNTRYIISAWVAGAYNNNPTKVFFELGGVSLNETVDLANKSGGQWTQLKSVWTSGDQTSIVLAIRKINTQGHNWFCLDDISITEAPISEFTWSGPNGFNANGKNQFVRNVALKNGGNYQLTVKDNGCVRKINLPVPVNCPACATPFIVSTKTNSPVSCGSPITFQTSSAPLVSYEWYNLNPDGSTTPFPVAEINKKNPTLSAPIVIGTNRYGYEVQARKDGCTASFTTAVEVKCEPSGNADLSLRLFKNSSLETVNTGDVFPICAEIKNESNQPIFSARAKVLLPECLTYYGVPSGLNTGSEGTTGGLYEDTWYNATTREVSNITTPERRGGNAYLYWGVPVGPNQSRYMCFYVQSSANTTVVLKGEIAGMETQYHQNMKDADSTPNNGYDNGEDDRSILKLNPLINQLEITKYQIFAPNTASNDVFDVIATNTSWTSVNSNTDWIQLNNITGNSGTTNIVVSFTENLSAKPRYGTITFKAACGLGEVVQIRQAGRDDCPSIDVSSNNPLCGSELKLFSSIVPAANKDLVTNGNFEKGNVDFSPEAFHTYNYQTGGTNSYVVSANPKSENGNTGLWFLNKECQPENSNPVCTVVNRVRVLHRTDCCFDRMNGATIQGSNNNGIWDVLYTFGNATGGWQDITLSNTKKYSYVRFVAGPNGYGELMSLEFYNGTTKLSGTPIGSPGTWGANIPVYGFNNALDNNDGSLWHGISPGNSNYVGYELNNCGTVPDLASNAGAGKQMAIVASWRQRDYFWSQTINVDPSTNYTISAKAVLLGTYDAVPLKIIFEVDGKEVNIASDLSTYGCNWKKITGTWNSGEKFGPVKLAIRFENPNSAEKAFAIDDISVKPVQQGTTSNGAISYAWSGPGFLQNDPKSVLPNPIIPLANAAKAGKYTLTVTQNGCPATESTDVAVGCNSTTCPAPTIASSYNVICANMNQSTTLTATNCGSGSIVKWSDGQTGVTISTGQIKNSTVYTAQCVNDCGASIKSNEVTVHVLPLPNPPTILGASTIYVSPGADGIILTWGKFNDSKLLTIY